MFIYVNGSCRCTSVKDTYFNSHIGETYVKPFTSNFFGYASNMVIDGFYFLTDVNEDTSLQTKTNGVITAENNCEIKNCKLSYIYIAAGNGDNVIIGSNIYKTTRFDGVADLSGKAIILKYLKGLTGPSTNRPPSDDLQAGVPYFDTTLNKPIWHKGNNVWVDATGATV